MDTSRLLDSDTELFFHTEPIDLAAVLHDACNLHRESSPGADPGVFWLPPADAGRSEAAVSGVQQPAVECHQILARLGDSQGSCAAYRRGDPVSSRIRGSVFPTGQGADLHPVLPRQQCSGLVGTGVGLFLVAIVVHLHDGDIVVDSGEGKGSRFTVTLPNRAR